MTFLDPKAFPPSVIQTGVKKLDWLCWHHLYRKRRAFVWPIFPSLLALSLSISIKRGRIYTYFIFYSNLYFTMNKWVVLCHIFICFSSVFKLSGETQILLSLWANKEFPRVLSLTRPFSLLPRKTALKISPIFSAIEDYFPPPCSCFCPVECRAAFGDPWEEKRLLFFAAFACLLLGREEKGLEKIGLLRQSCSVRNNIGLAGHQKASSLTL